MPIGLHCHVWQLFCIISALSFCCTKGMKVSWSFTSRSTARVILGQVLGFVTCESRTRTEMTASAKMPNLLATRAITTKISFYLFTISMNYSSVNLTLVSGHYDFYKRYPTLNITFISLVFHQSCLRVSLIRSENCESNYNVANSF